VPGGSSLGETGGPEGLRDFIGPLGSPPGVPVGVDEAEGESRRARWQGMPGAYLNRNVCRAGGRARRFGPDGLDRSDPAVAGRIGERGPSVDVCVVRTPGDSQRAATKRKSSEPDGTLNHDSSPEPADRSPSSKTGRRSVGPPRRSGESLGAKLCPSTPHWTETSTPAPKPRALHTKSCTETRPRAKPSVLGAASRPRPDTRLKTSYRFPGPCPNGATGSTGPLWCVSRS